MSGRQILSHLLLVTVVVVATWFVRVRRDPRACPFSQRTWLDMPRPFMRRQSLIDVLQPQTGERILEIGPGTAYYSLAVAPCLAPHGQLDAVEVQPEMIAELRQRRVALGIDNVVEHVGDAGLLPFPDATFDAVFLVATLGEIPDKSGALREIHRVLQPNGHLVVGEGQPDPHMVASSALRALGQEGGFQFDGTSGTRVGYFARFVPGP